MCEYTSKLHTVHIYCISLQFHIQGVKMRTMSNWIKAKWNLTVYIIHMPSFIAARMQYKMGGVPGLEGLFSTFMDFIMKSHIKSYISDESPSRSWLTQLDICFKEAWRGGQITVPILYPWEPKICNRPSITNTY